MSEKKLNIVLSSIIFLFSLIVYLMSMASTVSFWDCGEFIAVAYKMAVPHPPGAPFYLLLGRVFSLLPSFLGDVAAKVNLISVLSSAFTVLILYHIIVYFARKLVSSEHSLFDKIGIYGGAVIGALTFAFTHSFWFNAVEAEVYAPSMFFTALAVYLIMRWEVRGDKPGNERYLLMLFYVIGLASGVHLLNVLTLPFVFLIYYYRKFKITVLSFSLFVLIGGAIFAIIYPGIIFGVPKIAGNVGLIGLAVSILLIFIVFLIFRTKQQVVSFAMLSVLLILIGYSTYTTVYVRSNLNPNIDENNPETIENFISYLERDQYGKHTMNRGEVLAQSKNGKKYSSVGEFFWKYQVQHMYNRYFLWQFAGMDDNEFHVEGMRYLGIPLLLGLLGIAFQTGRDKKNAFAVFSLFFMTGMAIILYLNQPDPQPRERDYSYVGSFFAFAIWIGLGVQAIFYGLKSFKVNENKFVGIGLAALLLIASPLTMLAKDFHRQNRAGNYLAWDHSYNMLESCPPNAILFTFGDNDTFPLWYLQEVENIRTDVRIVNLQLLNTEWYIYQLKHLEPKVPMNLSDKDIEQIQRRVFSAPWETKNVKVKVPKNFQLKEYQQKIDQLSYMASELPVDTTGFIQFKLNPHIRSQGYGFLRVQDYMILHIIHANKWEKPICFSFTMPPDEMLDGMRNYLQVDGLIYKLTSQRGWAMNEDRVADLFTNKFKFRALNDKNVHYLDDQKALIRNYWGIFHKMNSNLISSGKIETAKKLLEYMHNKIDIEYLPFNNYRSRLFDMAQKGATGIIAPQQLADSLKKSKEKLQISSIMSEIYYPSEYAGDIINVLMEEQQTDKNIKNMFLNNYFTFYSKRNDKEGASKLINRIKEKDPNNPIVRQWERKFK